MLLKRKTKMSFKKTFICLMMGFYLAISAGCSQSPIASQSQPAVNVFPSDSLLTHPCKAVPAGESLIELAVAYNKNTSCIAKYKAQIEKIKENKLKQKELWNVK